MLTVKWQKTRYVVLFLFFVLLLSVTLPFGTPTADAAQTRAGSQVEKIAAGWSYSLALKSDGTVVAWGSNDKGQATVPTGIASPVKGTRVAAGWNHSLALKSDGTVVAWGYNGSGQSTVPAGLKDVISIAAGYEHSLALKSDGTVVAWGGNGDGQTNVPGGLNGVVSIAAGGLHSLALKSDGTVVAWGEDIISGQSTVPGGLNGVVSIAAGAYHSLALKSDGTVVAWGNNDYGQSTVPAGLKDVVSISGVYNSLALKSDGTVVAWGDNDVGQSTVPGGLNGVVSIAAGAEHSLALKLDGTVVAWGNNSDDKSTVPTGLKDVILIAAGGTNSLALKSDGTVVAWGLSTVPGNDNLNDLSLQEGPFDKSFSPTVTSYTYSYIGPSVSSVNVTAELADTNYAALYVNNQPQASGSAATVSISEDTTVIPVRVEPYFKPAKTYTITVLRDSTPPVIQFGANGNAIWSQSASTTVTVTDAESGVKSSSLQYAWTQSTVTPSTGWTSFASGGTLSKNGADGDWYLHIKALDAAGNTTNVASDRFRLDNTLPTISYGTNGNESWSQSASTTVTVTDAGSGVNASSLQYAWTQSTVTPTADWATFANGGALSKNGADGDWYLHIKAQDAAGNTANVVSGRFRLDNTAPAINISMTNADFSTYSDNTWSNQEVTIRVTATDANSVVSNVYSMNGGTTWIAYTVPITLQEGVHSLTFKAVDAAGNEAVLHRTVKISTSGLMLTPTMTTSGGSPYTSGEWSGTSVTVSVYAQAGLSGIASLTYTLDGGASQNYVNQDPLTLTQEGQHTMVFQVVDTAGNTFTATLAVNMDLTAPTVSFGTNGNESLSQSASTMVTVTDAGSGVDTSTLQYAWTTDTAIPAAGWTSFASGDTLSKNGADGDWYLHIKALDAAGNTANVVSSRFRLDNTEPAINISMTNADMSAYPDNAWSNQEVTIRVTATDANSVVSNVYSMNGGTTWIAYTVPITLQDGIHSLTFKAVDAAGNEAVLYRTVKISTSGLMLTPTMTTSGGSPYTSGAWSSKSVTVSVYAQAGLSGIASLTYTLDGGPWQNYVNQAPLTFTQEGQHTMVFQVVDTAGNTFTATLAVNIDLTAPSVSFGTNGNESWSQSGSTTVAVTDAGSGVDASSLQYAWTTDTATPAAGWTSFASGDTLSKNGVEGNWYLHIRAQDGAGNTANAVSNRFRLQVASTESASTGSLSYVADMKPVIDLNGTSLELDRIDMTKPFVTLEVTPKDGTAYVSIPANILSGIEGTNANFFIEIKTPYGSYQVPVNLASLLPGLKDLLAKNDLNAGDISFKVILTNKSDDKDIQKASADGLLRGQVVGPIVDFNMEIINTKNRQSVGTSNLFSKSLPIVIPMPKSMTSMPEQWGAFRYNEATKKFEFVPAKKVLIDGAWYVTISSYSNSVYVVAQNPVSFTDTLEHWSQAFVELAAAKGLVEGVGEGLYQPDETVTRAEFTAMLVRVLGHKASNARTASYDDVKPDSWYFNVIVTAKELGLLDFVNGNHFMPDQPLTREEMASMLAAVIKLKNVPMTKENVTLDGYKDIGDVNASYLDEVRLMVELEIMTGTDQDTFSPKGISTRAQAAVVFIRMMQKLDWID
ncbi:OmpL47-type beta-barrel domain-containing protein [Paenibacillus oceani]|uniref:S-layer homology domain-containing protein n=1 Tax=Paenibacillus oceani TaxID=2772510 RepID=A0A927CAS2_9BACL|nr:S-layer homology domain-containing protein [Paenibacillus oceani]MBD2862465.1 S-layer homology domain-containing protein [Paenibacillus oceani]